MTRQIFNIVIAFVVAFGLWVYVVTVVGPEYEDTFKDIPVTFIGEPADGLEVHNKQGHKVTLKLSGNRSDLNKLSVSNISVTVDLSQISQTGTRGYRYEVSFPGNVPHNAVIVQSQEPASIMLSVGRVLEKDVPIKLFYEGPTPDGYVKMEDPALPDVHVRGPEEIVNQIEYAKINILSEVAPEGDITGTYSYKLYDKDDNEVDADSVTPAPEDRTILVTYPIRATKKIKLSITPLYGGGITKENSHYTISPAEITVQGMPADLKKLDELNLGEVDFSTAKEGENFVISIEDKLDTISKDLIIEGQNTATVNVTFPQGLATKSFYVTRFEEIEKPENANCRIMVEGIKVTFRGSDADLAKLDLANIKIVVDYTDVVPAPYEQYVKATAVVDQNDVSVSVIEKDSVRVLVTAIPDEPDA